MKRPLMFFLLAGFAAVLASLVVYSALKKKDAEVEKATVKSGQIMVAAHDLSLGSKLDASSFKMIRWPKDNMPVGAIVDPHAVLNSVVKAPFLANEPIVTSKLFQGDKSSGVLPLLIPAGMRAMSVPVDEVADIAGFVQPNAHVDILVSMADKIGDKNKGDRSKIVLENVQVLATAQTIEQKDDAPQVVKVVTVLVTPEEAERLALASREGTLRLAMRNYGDDKIVLTSGIDVQGVFKAFSSAPSPLLTAQLKPTQQADKPFEVEVIRNGQTRESVGFDRGSGTKTKLETSDAASDEKVEAKDEKVETNSAGATSGFTAGSLGPVLAPPPPPHNDPLLRKFLEERAASGSGKTIDIQ